jgi:hypothetical protein
LFFILSLSLFWCSSCPWFSLHLTLT